MWNLFKKLTVGLVVGGGLVAVANSQEVPVSFQLLFFVVSLIGAVTFALLDAKAMSVMNGGMSFLAVTAFWVFLISVCVAGASFLPQFDPEDEKAKISKLLDKERKQSAQGRRKS
ncbi:MAG: hypothetical protein U0236_14195 [Nitrospira sp.]